MNTQTAMVNADELQKQSLSYPDKARQLAAIKDDRGMQEAGGFLVTIKGFRKQVEEFFAADIKKAFELHRSLTDKRKKADAPLDEAERIIKQSMARFQFEQEQKRRLEEETTRAAAQKAAEDAKLQEAEAAAESGDHERAESILQEPVVAVPVVAPPAPRVEGVSYREIWRAEVLDLMALVKGVADGRVPLTVLQANMMALNSLARSLKSAMNYPGVRAVAEKTVSAKSAA